MNKINSLDKLQYLFSKFPTIGNKSAERLAYSVLSMSDDEVDELINAIKEVKEKVHHCKNCGLLTESDICEICSSELRDHSTCIVLSNSKDIFKFENLKTYHGVYHVLGGDINISKGITPEELNIPALIERINKESIKELILATSPTIEGETTALYISKILADKDISITRIAYGIPVGGQFDYTDELTISKALEGRTKIK